MNGEFLDALEQLEKEKGIPMQSLLNTIEAAMASAYKKHYGSTEEVRIEVDRVNQTMRFFVRRPVEKPPAEDDGGDGAAPPAAEVEAAAAPSDETTDAPASALDAITVEADRPLAGEVPTALQALAGVDEGVLEEVAAEEEIVYEDEELDASIFGRIAAQTAKQVVVQRIREAEREITFDEYVERIGEVMTGEVQRKDSRNVFISLGRVEALLPPHEQMPGEPHRFNDRLKVFILDVRRTTKNPQIIVSRTHPMLVIRLLELEVPEISDGIVEIKAIAREAGSRSKVAVVSHEPQVDPMGACVGHRGSRVQGVVDELRGEKVDIVRWNEDTGRYMESALSPAKVSKVVIREDEQAATVIVPDNQLSLAIGRRGINVRLAARLTGWKIDIRSETQYVEELTGIEAAAVDAAGGKRVRIYELARELEVPTRDLMDVLAEEGIEVKSHASTVSPEQATQIRELVGGAAPEEAVPEEDASLAAALAAAARALAATEDAGAEDEQGEDDAGMAAALAAATTALAGDDQDPDADESGSPEAADLVAATAALLAGQQGESDGSSEGDA